MKYLVAFIYVVNVILRGVVNMLTVNINGKKASLWGTLAQMAIAGVASYGMAKAANPNESWNGYRDAMLNNMAQVAIPFAIQYVPGMKEQADANPGVEVQQ